MALACRFAVAIGTLSPNNSAFNIVENVSFASSSLCISISLSLSKDEFLKLRASGKVRSSWLRLKAACRSTPVRLGMYRSLNTVLLLRLRSGEAGMEEVKLVDVDVDVDPIAFPI